jgi:Zn finger protein HypA/HybF involved in hydrogenase expression
MELGDLEKFRAGKDDDGADLFHVPLTPDAEGMVGRECPNEQCKTKHFKICIANDGHEPDSTMDLREKDLMCPYCGTSLQMQDGATKAQLAWIESLVIQGAMTMINDTMEDAFSGCDYMTYTRGDVPVVHPYEEEKLRRSITCEACQNRYAVYGITFYCPWCGGMAFHQHLAQDAKTIRVLAEEAGRIGAEHGQQASDRMVGDAYENVVSLFEGMLKILYRHAVQRRHTKADAEKLMAQIRVNFQRLSGADEFFDRDLAIKLFGTIAPKERAVLEGIFAKRHVLTHNLGLIDEKFRGQAWQRPGAEVPLDRQEILDGLLLVERIVGEAAKGLGL